MATEAQRVPHSRLTGADRALRLFHTVRYLKPSQMVWRVRHRLSGVRPDVSPAPVERVRLDSWVQPCLRQTCLLDRWTVCFLNETGSIATAAQWNDPNRPKLWLYNLHYFDDLCAAGAEARRPLQRALIARWVAENPPGAGNGWESYPVSLRICNWIKWSLAGEALEPEWRDSLAVQARWLNQHIEWHLLGNHLAANAKALVFAGLFFGGVEGEAWLQAGLAIYARELPEQILADGGHFELSPMYHAIMLEDVLDLINLARVYGASSDRVLASLEDLSTRMRRWLQAMTHPDGGLSFFNDAAFGIAATQLDLEAYAERLGLPKIEALGEGVHYLAASGYVRVNRGEMAAILDVAAVGPDYIPGHAHADTLSFELSLGGDRIVVNSGTSTYAPGALREAQRATRAHSTVEVAGLNSTEVWSSFRVARRARVRDLAIARDGADDVVTAAHDGYWRLPGQPTHRRTWRFSGTGLTITDAIEAKSSVPAVSRFYFGPDVDARGDAVVGQFRLMTVGGRTIALSVTADAKVEAAAWYPEFGRSVVASSLAAQIGDGQMTTRIDWSA